MAPKWTDEQLNAITTTDRGVIVPAAAGSGKTAVLIERTVRLLEDRSADVPAEKLMAVTFSRDAAEQIRSKLRNALADRIVNEQDRDTRAWLSRQQEMLPLAKISTINAFCLGIVRDNLAASDYRSGLRICDDTQAASLINEAMGEVFEKYCTECPDKYELLIDAFTKGSDEALGEVVQQLYGFRRSLAFPGQWTAETLADLKSADCAGEMLKDTVKELRARFDKAYNDHLTVLAAADTIAKKTKSFSEAEASDTETMDRLRKVFSYDEESEPAYDIYRSIYENTAGVGAFARMVFPRKAVSEEQELGFRNGAAARKRMIEQVRAIVAAVNAIGPEPIESMQVSAEIFEALTELTELLEKTVDEKKTDSGLAEFGDLERRAMNLLVELDENGEPQRTELARSIRDSRAYAVMLIDEYQDVNNLEERIFRAISDTDDLSMLGKNVFVVGDVKQSIYKFRQANPLLFREAIKNARKDEFDALCEIRLTRNFRSRRNILDFVNMLFTRIMSEKMGEVDYDDRERLNYGASYQGEDPPVVLMMTDSEVSSGDEDEGEESASPLKYVIFGEEELGIAKQIKAMLENGAPVTEGSGKRRCRPSDFCVLARNNASCDRMAAALAYIGLRADAEKSKGYMGSREIVIMINLLRVIDNRMNDNAMASVMLSPIMSFDAGELAKLRLLCFGKADGSERSKHLAQIIAAAAKTEEDREKGAEVIDLGDAALTEKCRTAQRLLDRMSFLALSLTLEELIARIYEETDLFAVASAAENAAQRRANLRMLTRYAAEYERDMTGGISGFLHFLDGVAEAKKDFDQAVTVTAGADAVSIKTFHRSKGLEYPFVFLAMLGKGFNKKDLNYAMLLSEQNGVGIKYKQHEKLASIDTLAHIKLMRTIKFELWSEQIRLLYVALTRAKEQLFIPIAMEPSLISKLIDGILDAGGLTPELLAECNNYLGWIYGALLLTDMRGKLLEAAERADAEERLKELSPVDAAPAKIVWQTADTEITDGEQKAAFVKARPEPETVRRMVERYSFRFSDDETRSPAKRSVTELVSEIRAMEQGKELAESTFFPQLGQLEAESDRLTAAQRGTYTHLFMQHADYSLAEQDAAAELKRLTSTGRFTEKEASGVYIDAVKAFFGGELYERMKRSDNIKRELKFMVRANDAGLGEKYASLISPNGMIQGVCDCVFEESDGFVLVDYKTDNFTDPAELEKYTVQLELYKAALDLILPKPVKACLIYSFKLKCGRVIDV